MSKVRVAVVGVGSLGQHHARIAAASEAADLVAVVDPAEARGREIAGKFGTGWVPVLEAVLDRVDAVQIAAPTGCHRALGLAVLEAGKHVLMEKPLAATLEEGRDLLAALDRARAARPGLVAAVGPPGAVQPGGDGPAGHGHQAPLRRGGPGFALSHAFHGSGRGHGRDDPRPGPAPGPDRAARWCRWRRWGCPSSPSTRTW